MRSTSFLPLVFLFSLLSSTPITVSALRLIVSPKTTTNAPTTVYWIREASDPQPLFDLRFVVQEDGQDIGDVGLAAANIVVALGEGKGDSRMGKEEVQFPRSGNYVLKAVAGPTFQVIGTSNEVVVSPPGTMTLSASTTPTSSRPTSTQTNETGAISSPKPSNKAGIIVGAVLGSLALLLLIAALLFILLRRRKKLREERLTRLSFHPEDMVQRRLSRSNTKAKWVSRLSLRVNARDGGEAPVPQSAPAWGTNGFVTVNGGNQENPFATPKNSPPANRDVSFAIPPPPAGVAPPLPALAALEPKPKASILASIPPSRREQIQREMRNSDASKYSQDSPDLEAAIVVTSPTTPASEEPKRRSGAWNLIEQALANVKRRASMVSRSSTVLDSRVGSPLPGPVSASPYVSTFTPATMSTAASPSLLSTSPAISRVESTVTSTTPSRAATPKTNMAERAGKRISILPTMSAVAAPIVSPPPKAHVRGLPPVPLGPTFDTVTVLSASPSMRGHKKAGSASTQHTSCLSGSETESSLAPQSTISYSGSDTETDINELTDKERDENVAPLSIKPRTPQTPSFPSSATLKSRVEALSEKAKGKQRSNSVLPLRSAGLSSQVNAMETIPASPATTSGDHSTSTHAAEVIPPTPIVEESTAVAKEEVKVEEPVKPKERRPLPTPLVLAPIAVATASAPSSPIVKRPLPTPALKTPATAALTSAKLRVLPALPPTPATALPGAIMSAAPYTPSFPVPQIPSYPETPKTSTFISHPVPLTPGLRGAEDVPQTPLSASVVRTPSYTRDTIPPVLRTYTKRQRHIEHRIGQVKVQLRLLKRKMDTKQVDGEVGRRVVRDLEKQLAWLEMHLHGDWANEVEGAQRPEEWGRYMRP